MPRAILRGAREMRKRRRASRAAGVFAPRHAAACRRYRVLCAYRRHDCHLIADVERDARQRAPRAFSALMPRFRFSCRHDIDTLLLMPCHACHIFAA